MSSIEVAVRVRPLNQRELRYSSTQVVDIDGLRTSISHPKRKDEKPRVFTFDHCFSSTDPADVEFADQRDVFEKIGQPLVDAAIGGIHACLFAYGQTGSGKSYAMLGTPSNPGLVQRISESLFDSVDWNTQLTKVECSFIEIYNEAVRDLLNPQNVDKALKVRQHPKLGVHVEGVTKLLVTSAEEIKKLLDEGTAVRSVASTNMNAHSSRSHAILCIEVHANKDGQDVFSRLNLVDLAGSERASATTGDIAAAEGANINKSLLTLGMCLSRLADSSTSGGGKGSGLHVPFRDSQLTWLLHESLGGNCQTAMLATISPASICYDETLSTLRFAETVKRVRQAPVVNEDPQQRLIRELRDEIEAIKAQLKAIEQGGAAKGGATKAELLQQLVDSTELFQDASESPEERLAKQRALQSQRQKGLAKLRQANRIHADTSIPRLQTLNEDMLKFPDVALLYYLRDGESKVGRADECQVQIKVKGSRDIAELHCVIAVSSLMRTVTIRACEDDDGLDAVVYVNGAQLRGSRPLQHLDRVIIGPLAFRHVLPTSWVEVAQGEFSRDATNPTHLASIEEFDRLVAELQRYEELCDVVGAEAAAQAIPEGPELRQRIGELEAKLAAAYPASDAPSVGSVEQAVRFDFKYAMAERERVQHAKTQEELRALEAKGRVQDAEIDNLLGELDDVEAAVDKIQKEKEDLETRAEVLAAQQQKPGSPGGGGGGGARHRDPINLDDSVDELMMQQLMQRGTEIDPNDLVSRSADASAAVLNLKAQLARELLDYEAEMNRARQWKPEGPTDAAHRKQYEDLVKRVNIGHEHVMTKLGPIAHSGRIYKLRIKRSVFHRGGFHPVKAAVQGRFLYYFEENATTEDALGGCYLYGADLQFVPDIGDMRWCIRITPTAPRKSSKSAKGITEENNIVLGFDTEPQMLEWMRKLKIATEPEISEALARYFGDDVAIEPAERSTKPPRRATAVQQDETVAETPGDKSAVEAFKTEVSTARPVASAPKPTPRLGLSAPVKLEIDAATAEIGDDWELIDEPEYTETIPEEVRAYRIPLRTVHNFRFLKAYFRTSLEADEKLKARQKNRMWLVDHFTHTVQVVDIKNRVAHVYTARQLLVVEKDHHECTKLRLGFFHHGFHSYTEYCVSMEERERFFETASAIRPTVRVFCPPLVIGKPGERVDSLTPIDGTGAEAQDVTSTDPGSGASAKQTLSGECLLRVSRAPTEPVHIWTGTLNLGGIPLQSAELLGKWIPRGRFDLYVVAVQEASYRRSQTQFFEFMGKFFGSDYLTVASMELYDVLLVVVARRRHFMKITNIEGSSCPSTIEALSGERGGVGIAFKFLNTSFCFVAVHLPGNATRQDLRRFILNEVLSGLLLGDKDSDVCNQFDHLFVLGDFNYPALKGASIEAIQRAVEQGKLAEYAAQYDSLIVDVAKSRTLNGFSEPEINFPPTYCVEVGTARYNIAKVATPTYRGRIFVKSASHGPTDDEDDKANLLQCTSYQCSRDLTIAEHLPVHATFVAHCLRPAATCFMPSPIQSIVLGFEVVSVQRLNIVCQKPAVKIVSPLFEAVHFQTNMCAVTPSVYEWNEGERADLVTTSLEYIDNCFFLVILYDAGEADELKRHKGTACFSLKEAINRDNENAAQSRRAVMQRGGRFITDVEVSFRWTPM